MFTTPIVRKRKKNGNHQQHKSEASRGDGIGIQPTHFGGKKRH
jgi:hypothetical protein